ncbi:MAG: methyltransferase domain-containing protein [Halopseudomonas sp.]
MVKSNSAQPNNPQQAKWNQRYQQAERINPAARVITDNLHLLPLQGNALELACGLGGNALELAGQGLNTQAWDLSNIAIDKLQQLAELQQLPLQARCIDIQQHSLSPESFDLICVTGFLERSLCPAIIAALKPSGLLFYQTFTRAKINQSGPSNPQFLLQQGELLSLFGALTPLVYREELDSGKLEQGLRNQAYLVARK